MEEAHRHRHVYQPAGYVMNDNRKSSSRGIIIELDLVRRTNMENVYLIDSIILQPIIPILEEFYLNGRPNLIDFFYQIFNSFSFSELLRLGGLSINHVTYLRSLGVWMRPHLIAARHDVLMI